MPMDEYDSGHPTTFKASFHFSCDDLYFSKKDKDEYAMEIINNTIATDGIRSKEFYNEIIKQMNTLMNGLSILECRQITNLGARVCYYNPDNYDEELGNRCEWYLVQVWRGSLKKDIL